METCACECDKWNLLVPPLDFSTTTVITAIVDSSESVPQKVSLKMVFNPWIAPPKASRSWIVIFGVAVFFHRRIQGYSGRWYSCVDVLLLEVDVI